MIESELETAAKEYAYLKAPLDVYGACKMFRDAFVDGALWQIQRDIKIAKEAGRIDIAKVVKEQYEQDDDPSPWCGSCGAKSPKQCQCGPVAEND